MDHREMHALSRDAHITQKMDAGNLRSILPNSSDLGYKRVLYYTFDLYVA